MFAGWFIKVVVHIFLVSDSCQPPVPTATTWNIVLTLTLDCGRHHRTRGEHTTPQIPGVFSPTSSCNAPVTSQRADRVQTQSIQGSLALFSICALSHMNACPQNVQKGRKEKKRHQTETQANSWLDGFTTTAPPFLANSLCLLSLSMDYVIVHFHWERVLARTLISEQLSFHTKEVLEINWHWSLQKRLTQ